MTPTRHRPDRRQRRPAAEGEQQAEREAGEHAHRREEQGEHQPAPVVPAERRRSGTAAARTAAISGSTNDDRSGPRAGRRAADEPTGDGGDRARAGDEPGCRRSGRAAGATSRSSEAGQSGPTRSSAGASRRSAASARRRRRAASSAARAIDAGDEAADGARRRSRRPRPATARRPGSGRRGRASRLARTIVPPAGDERRSADRPRAGRQPTRDGRHDGGDARRRRLRNRLRRSAAPRVTGVSHRSTSARRRLHEVGHARDGTSDRPR